MSCSSGPLIATGNILLDIDPANTKSYNYYPTTTDHCISTWFCFYTASVTYSIITANVSIFQNDNGVITTIVAGQTNPQRGTFIASQGCTYYGNGPVFLMAEGLQFAIAPISMAGTQFVHFLRRDPPGTLYVYSPYTSSVVNFFDGSATGIYSTATSTFTLHKGEYTSIQLPSLDTIYLSATQPILVSASQIGSDRTILTPASQYVYNRVLDFNSTIAGTVPTTLGSYVVYDTTYLVMIESVADGAGGDCAQGLGYQHLCDRYSFGDALSDYFIVAPYNVTVTVSYWNGTAWVVWDTHVLTGTQTAPGAVGRDGTAGPGVNGTNFSGTAAFMASGTTGPWKWEGTNPFFVSINDIYDQEYSMLGWLNAKLTRVTSDFCLSDTGSTNGVVGKPIGSPTYSSTNNGILTFNGTNYVSCGNLGTFPTQGAISFWMYSTSVTSYCNPLHTNYTGSASNIGIRFEQVTGGTFYAVFGNDAGTISTGNLTTSLQANTWYNVVVTWNTTTNVAVGYMNRVQAFSISNTYWPSQFASVSYGIGYGGARGFIGSMANVSFYNSGLTLDQVVQNFNALRSRYGI